jgi:AraC-like DNA-binding protein
MFGKELPGGEPLGLELSEETMAQNWREQSQQMSNTIHLTRVSWKKYRILLIDPSARSYFMSLVASLKNCFLLLMPNYDKAKEFFSYNPVDLVLLDHPDPQSCIEMLQFFKSLKPSIPVLIMTAQGSEDFALKVFRHGAQDYFQKPLLEMDKLAERIQVVLRIAEVSEKNETPVKGLHRGVIHIQESYNTALKLPQVAREAGMSISSFERNFKKEMRMTFTDYVNSLRITQAAEMLMKDDLSMSDIAFACGYNNQFHFTRMFKRMMRTSPSLYRKSLKP